jgi:serine/threonine protein phosphatase PrpC
MVTQSSQLTVFARSHVGRVRMNNEDSFVVADLTSAAPVQPMPSLVRLDVKGRGVLLAVSDGMGGVPAGEVASLGAIQALLEGMMKVEATSADVALRQCVEGASGRVWTASQAEAYAGMGATLTAVLFAGLYAFVAEVGDSRAYVLRGAKLVRLTHDQTLGQQLVDAGALTEQEADASGHRNIITQGMGLKPTVVVAMGRFPLRRGDRFLLCSDGLSGKVDDEELQRTLAMAATLEIIAGKLLAMALERGGEDNITLILAETSGEGVPQIADAERGSAVALTEYAVV